jgi:hypothetical protein
MKSDQIIPAPLDSEAKSITKVNRTVELVFIMKVNVITQTQYFYVCYNCIRAFV